MGRKNRRAPQAVRPQGRDDELPVESHPDGDWVVRRVTGSAATSTYRCPGCDQEIRPATSHVVAWPVDAGVDDRRHWHTPCWTARDRRGPVRR